MDSSMINRLARPDDFGLDGQLQRRHRLVTEDILHGQHPIRTWEYTQALDALEAWYQRIENRPGDEPHGLTCADVGAAGSQFWRALSQHSREHPVARIDPALSDPVDPRYKQYPMSLGLFRTAYPDLRFDAVFCLSVLEHVPDDESEEYSHFLHDLTGLVKPGGLLMITVDAAETDTDRYHFCWMRERIYNPDAMGDLVTAVTRRGFTPIGSPNWDYEGPTLYDYTVAALACSKGPPQRP